MFSNPWKSCKYNPPAQYTRVEIKSHKGDRYVGYRYKKQYYETFGNFIIPDPYKWRKIPSESWLWYEIKRKLENPDLFREQRGICMMSNLTDTIKNMIRKE
jgi:hypothetical protein